MSKFQKILISFLILLAIITGVVGYYIKNTRIIDLNDYSILSDRSEDFEYIEEINFEYLEERILFNSEVEDYLSKMTNEEKIAQIFFISPESLTGLEDEYATISGNLTKEKIDEYPVGGLIYTGNNITSIEQARRLLNGVNDYSKLRINLPLMLMYKESAETLGLNEYLNIKDEYIPNELALIGDDELINKYIDNRIKGLKSFGFNTYYGLNVNLNDELNKDPNSFGQDPFYASQIIEDFAQKIHDNNLILISSKFPKSNDTQVNLDHLISGDFITIQTAIDLDSEGIILSNDISKAVTESSSKKVAESENSFDILRGRMGYEAIAFTDDISLLNLENEKEYVLNCFLAGCDGIINPNNFLETYDYLIECLNEGKISNTRINNAVGRIITAKLARLY